MRDLIFDWIKNNKVGFGIGIIVIVTIFVGIGMYRSSDKKLKIPEKVSNRNAQIDQLTRP